MEYSAKGVQVRFFETKKIDVLEKDVNNFLEILAGKDEPIIDIRYLADKEEYEKHFTAMVIYKKRD